MKKGYASPNNLEEANELVNDCKVTRIIIIVIQLLISPIMYIPYSLVKTSLLLSLKIGKKIHLLEK